MHKNWLVAGVAAAALIPSLAMAQTSCEQRANNNRAASTVAGAVIGAVIGSNVSGRGAKTEGSVIGAIAGGAIGNQVGKSRAGCENAYGYYDNDGRWHASATNRTAAAGYYDRNGAWVDGQPNGYYDTNGRWVSANAQAAGYYDANGYWVPARSAGYYDVNGRWSAPSAYDNARDTSYESRSRWDGAPANLRQRTAWLDQRVRRGLANGTLSREDGNRALRELSMISRQERSMRHYRNGQLGQRDQATIQARLDNVSANLRWNSRRDDRRY